MASSPDAAVIDLATKPKDHLTALPSELLHLVFDYVFPTHIEDIAFLQEDVLVRLKKTPHDLEKLAMTCHSLRDELDAWARHWVISHAEIARYKPLKNQKKESSRLMLRAKHCIFCGKYCSRSAILSNGFRCCTKCDLKHWPDKITKTQAKEEFNLRDHQLLPQQHSPVLVKHGANKFPRLRYGTCMTSNIRTTMFLREDVRRLAEAIHGDVEAHMAAQRRAADARKRKMEANAEKKRQMDVEWMRLIAQSTY
ncbi:hypothetical protein LTR78_002173 [Recurvomyces mirabilis]|uniref:F-box domain-containing protein n=1 Tax=Recurvomyces mirabilis TaxID=574656 RepID=A0AAE1C4V8_9PEZI|nr:hypothetical protein LTR78_002173 [Recurvomyces mirabilis]KAK5160630.1 hypothetical protein LTS14_001642 [Recurvomyces mirabilis]